MYTTFICRIGTISYGIYYCRHKSLPAGWQLILLERWTIIGYLPRSSFLCWIFLLSHIFHPDFCTLSSAYHIVYHCPHTIRWVCLAVLSARHIFNFPFPSRGFQRHDGGVGAKAPASRFLIGRPVCALSLAVGPSISDPNQIRGVSTPPPDWKRLIPPAYRA